MRLPLRYPASPWPCHGHRLRQYARGPQSERSAPARAVSLLRAHHFGESVNEKRSQQPAGKNLNAEEEPEKTRCGKTKQADAPDVRVSKGGEEPPLQYRLAPRTGRTRTPVVLLAEIHEREGILQRVNERVEPGIVGRWQACLLEGRASVWRARGGPPLSSRSHGMVADGTPSSPPSGARAHAPNAGATFTTWSVTGDLELSWTAAMTRLLWDFAWPSFRDSVTDHCSLKRGGFVSAAEHCQMTGNPVQIGDGRATVTDHELPRATGRSAPTERSGRRE